MIKRFNVWLRERFLPEWARRQLVEENEKLIKQLAEERREIKQMEAYIQGLHDGLRRQRQIMQGKGKAKNELFRRPF